METRSVMTLPLTPPPPPLQDLSRMCSCYVQTTYLEREVEYILIHICLCVRYSRQMTNKHPYLR